MEVQINLKYSIGDEVRYNGSDGVFHYCYGRSWYSQIPEEDNHWKIDGYAVCVEKDGIKVKYCFHAYCNKYFEYHDLIDEDKLEAISEAHQQTIDWEIKDALGNPIELGDIVYSGLYRRSIINNELRFANTLSFVSRGLVTSFIKAKNISQYYNDTVIIEDFDGGRKFSESCNSIISKIPYSFVEDMAYMALASSNSTYDMGRVKKISGWFGFTDECLAKSEEIKKLKKSGKSVKKKKVTKKKAAKKDDFDASKLLKGLSKEEREQLLKELTKN